MDIGQRASRDAHAQGQARGAADLVPLFDENLVFAVARALEFRRAAPAKAAAAAPLAGSSMAPGPNKRASMALSGAMVSSV